MTHLIFGNFSKMLIIETDFSCQHYVLKELVIFFRGYTMCVGMFHLTSAILCVCECLRNVWWDAHLLQNRRIWCSALLINWCVCSALSQEENDVEYEEEREVADVFDSDFDEDVSLHFHQGLQSHLFNLSYF